MFIFTSYSKTKYFFVLRISMCTILILDKFKLVITNKYYTKYSITNYKVNKYVYKLSKTVQEILAPSIKAFNYTLHYKKLFLSTNLIYS